MSFKAQCENCAIVIAFGDHSRDWLVHCPNCNELVLASDNPPKRPQKQPATLPVDSSTVEFPDASEYEFDIVGESHYQKNLEAICGGRDRECKEFRAAAEIRFEDDNPFDDKAVAVFIQDMKVGYFSRDEARSFRRWLKKHNCDAKVLTCNALIVGGWDRGPDNQGMFGVRLDLRD